MLKQLLVLHYKGQRLWDYVMTKREFLLEGGRAVIGSKAVACRACEKEGASFIVEELVSQASLDEQLF